MNAADAYVYWVQHWWVDCINSEWDAAKDETSGAAAAAEAEEVGGTVDSS